MILETIIKLILEVALFLIASYFIFYRSWLKSLGKEVAKLSTARDLTSITESIKNDFKESIETYKNKLDEELSLKIEPLKSELNKQNISHQIQYSYLHQERAKVLIELYQKLQELYSAMANWTAIVQPVFEDAEKEREERAIRANTALLDFKNYFQLNKLFFNQTFCSSIEVLIKEYWDKAWDFGYKQQRVLEGKLTREEFREYSKELSGISKELSQKIPPMIDEIEKICRGILNVEEE